MVQMNGKIVRLVSEDLPDPPGSLNCPVCNGWGVYFNSSLQSYYKCPNGCEDVRTIGLVRE